MRLGTPDNPECREEGGIGGDSYQLFRTGGNRQNDRTKIAQIVPVHHLAAVLSGAASQLMRVGSLYRSIAIEAMGSSRCPLEIDPRVTSRLDDNRAR